MLGGNRGGGSARTAALCVWRAVFYFQGVHCLVGHFDDGDGADDDDDDDDDDDGDDDDNGYDDDDHDDDNDDDDNDIPITAHAPNS